MTAKRLSLGWLPDVPDFRDYHDRTEQVGTLLEAVGVSEARKVEVPKKVDLRQWCSPVEDQETIGSCTANAGVGLIEFFQRRAFGEHLDASRLFLYKVTRKLLGLDGDTGAFLRDTMKAMVLFGVPPEVAWPYEPERFDVEPTAYCYAYASNYQAIDYYRLDPPGASGNAVLARIKANLSASLPAMFGFTVYSSISQAASDGKIPFPSPGDSREGGHAVVAVGYDDGVRIQNRDTKKATIGAFLIRNSWGTSWGNNGYGWLPYEYVAKHLAIDWWSLISSEWVDTGVFRA
jgi:C1A family cysteine protease